MLGSPSSRSSVINFLQKFVQPASYPIFSENSFTKRLAFILMQKFYYKMIFCEPITPWLMA